MSLPTAVRKKADEAARMIAGNQPTPPAAAPAPAADAELDRLNKEVARLTAANKVLQEKYNAETPRLMSENDALKKRVAELEAQMKRKFEEGDLSSLTEEERTYASPELLKIIGKAAREVSAATIDEQMKPLRERVDQFQKQTEAAYYVTLDREAPGWNVTNEKPEFMAWLQQADPASGQLRDNLLQTAHAAQQGYRVAEIFLAFREGREIGARAPSKPSNSPSPGPGSEGGQPLINPEEKKTWTRAQIAEFYREKREGKWKGKEKEARELELDIAAAYKEGRITG